VFNLVGFAGFATQLGTIALLTRCFGWSPFAATAAALELAALQNFFGHTRWTWRDRPAGGWREWLRRYWRYQIAKTASLAANLAITALLIQQACPGACTARFSPAPSRTTSSQAPRIPPSSWQPRC
jgi:putative flippase GtrA